MNFTYGQGNLELHQKTLSFLYENPPNSKQVVRIPTGNAPTAIAIDNVTHIVYVANALSNTVSVINGTVNTKMFDIRVGVHPTYIVLDKHSHKIYVANALSNTISVINETNNTKILDIPV